MNSDGYGHGSDMDTDRIWTRMDMDWSGWVDQICELEWMGGSDMFLSPVTHLYYTHMKYHTVRIADLPIPQIALPNAEHVTCVLASAIIGACPPPQYSPFTSPLVSRLPNALSLAAADLTATPDALALDELNEASSFAVIFVSWHSLFS
ncbi:hypothetical protein BDR07DRAFT_1498243 [Suillus spraguei]|nr:hypothetical protein BDR07DRAFT_1498243 [Suillus spraguei]